MKKILAITTTVATYLLTSSPALALTTVDPCPQGDGSGTTFNRLCSSLNGDSFGALVGKVVTYVLIIAIIIALAFLIFGGVKWILSGGDKGKVEAARSTIIAAIIGLIITFLAFFILSLVLNFFGLGTLNTLQLPTL